MKTARAVKKGFDIVVIVGGNGAVLQVAPSLAKTKVAQTSRRPFASEIGALPLWPPGDMTNLHDSVAC